MISFLVKSSLLLFPYRKFTYFFAAVLLGCIIYQLAFVDALSAAKSSTIMLMLLALAWLALLNLMVQIFSRVPIASQGKQSFILRIKGAFRRGVYYFLSLMFLAISMSIIILTFKMLRL
jgi:hypothetical protein